MRKFSTLQMVLAAMVAAVYTVLTVFLPIPQYGEVQFRVAECMTLLPFLFFPILGFGGAVYLDGSLNVGQPPYTF